MMSYFINLVRQQLAIVRSVGGWKGAFFRLLREGNVRSGTLVGTDQYGNKYYENNSYFMARNRFVEYPYVDRLTRSEEHTSELQSRQYLVCRLLLEKKKQINK